MVSSFKHGYKPVTVFRFVFSKSWLYQPSLRHSFFSFPSIHSFLIITFFFTSFTIFILSLSSFFYLIFSPSTHSDIKPSRALTQNAWSSHLLVPVTPSMNLPIGVQCSSVPYHSLLWSFEAAVGPHHGGTGNAAASVSKSSAWTRESPHQNQLACLSLLSTHRLREY